jgi:5-oxopent-3-ene-1,2,5-tricarboxylate decarboxylase / 2-hydroxyhepta-2,4-diene-1,7-dioate isomerase
VSIRRYPEELEHPPWPNGQVCGAVLNYRADLEGLGDRLRAAPYLAPPEAPVLYLKPRNTWIADGDPIPLPAPEVRLCVGTTLGLVFGRTCVRATEASAAEFITGLCVINDVCLPHELIFRPAIRERCRDGFCPIGAVAGMRPGGLAVERRLRTYINGELRAEWHTSQCVRSAARLIEDVSAFMTFRPGDILMLGTPRDMPIALTGDRVVAEVEGIGRLENPITAQDGT